MAEEALFVGGGGEGHATAQRLLLKYANRHGLIAGATGTGKTVTLQILAEGFSDAGVPVLMTDVKGDLAGIAQPGDAAAKTHAAFAERARIIGYEGFAPRGFPVTFWDIFGEKGHPVRATVAEMGPLLLSRLMDLSEAQEGVLNIAFRLADEEGLPMLDLADLKAVLVFVGQNAGDLSLKYGNVTVASVGAIQRRILVLENEGGERLFGEPALDLGDLVQVDAEGRGRVNVISAERLMTTPRLYATFLLWLLSELFEELPEVGDPEKPVLVFFFDEAHLLFGDAPKGLVAKVEQVARLIRSKGVGVYFITQNPDDVPAAVLGQLGNRVQHALRAFTARDARALRQAAETYRANPGFDTETAIREVGTGEAVTSLLEAKGVPGMVERTLIRPPVSRLGPIAEEARAELIAASPFAGKYDIAFNRDSAAEMLDRRAAAAARAASEAAERPPAAPGAGPGTRIGTPAPAPRRSASGGRSDSVAEAFAKSFARQLGTKSGQALVRGILGGLFKGR